ncbi:MAG: hypothetical protein HUU55_15730 [Myxococcales bacterium]|nr:hypothetical protein [Myxococcales bacterium]
MKRWCGISSIYLVFLSILAWGTPLVAAELPNMAHVWRLEHKNWGGTCAGKWTRFYTMDVTECNLAKAGGYSGSCNASEPFSADHYLSTVYFTNSVEIFRLSLAGSCGGCKDTFILTPNVAWKNELLATGWKHEKTFYGWDPKIYKSATATWGLVPVYHGYNAAMCDNFYSEHPGQMSTVYAQGYTTNTKWELTDGNYSVAYVAADGRLDLTITCSGVTSCSWSLVVPGNIETTGTGTKSFKNLPSHIYTLTCTPVAGMTVSPSSPTPYDLEFFKAHTLTCAYTCNNQCTQGQAPTCAGGDSTKSCIKNAQGCWVWSAPLSCADPNPCTDDFCSNGQCSSAMNFNTCDDNNPCTIGDVCQNGACKSGSPKNCDDNKPCTNDSCSGGNCQNVPNSNACNDGDPCTQFDQCAGGFCSGTPKICNDNNACTDDFCSNGNCQSTHNFAACNDNNACTTNDACSAGTCKGGPPLVCSDANPCTQDGCVPSSGCSFTSAAGACDDGNVCTQNDMCSGGKCIGGPTMVCDDKNVCTVDSCQPQAGCVYASTSAACDDANDCTANDMCAGGKCAGTTKNCDDGIACTADECQSGKGCVYTPQPAACNDDNPCTTDTCGPTGCTFDVNAAACSDNNPCTVGDQCAEGVCISGGLNTCDDAIPCTEDACNPQQGCTHQPNHTKCADNVACTTDSCSAASGCEHAPQPAECSDNNPCTTEFCDAGAGCVYLEEGAVVCDDKNPCTTDICSATDGCKYTAIDGVPCDDKDPCTAKEQCALGICVPVAFKCSDGNPCTADLCDSKGGACSNVAINGACDDQDVCTSGDECVAGKCVGKPQLKCTDANPCTDEFCDPIEGCQFVPNALVCSDGDPCTEGDQCKEGVCVPGLPKGCNDNNPCTSDGCGPKGQCEYTPILGPCNDSDPCTADDQCQAGICAGIPKADCCATDSDCPNPQPECLDVACVAGTCKTKTFCPTDACGPNPCDESVSCGSCFAFETCVSGKCYETCSPSDKNVTRCANDGKILEKCTKDEPSGALYWSPTDCVAQGEAGCAFSKDKNLFVCCTPDCSGKECGAPSACGISCGLCAAGEICCEAGEDCQQAAPSNVFQCLDCCWNQECGPSLEPGCNKQCGTCFAGETCKSGHCIANCEDAGITEGGICVGHVAWWCDLDQATDPVQTEDCAEYSLTCCYVDELKHVGCCDCIGECESKGWSCGVDSCGNPCGEWNGECEQGAVCVLGTKQCKCTVPELCGKEVDAGGIGDDGGEKQETAPDIAGAADTAGSPKATSNEKTKAVGTNDGCSCSQRPVERTGWEVGIWLAGLFLMYEWRRGRRARTLSVQRRIGNSG